MVAKVITQTGYEGAVSLEILPYPDGISAARLGLGEMRRVWG